MFPDDSNKFRILYLTHARQDEADAGMLVEDVSNEPLGGLSGVLRQSCYSWPRGDKETFHEQAC